MTDIIWMFVTFGACAATMACLIVRIYRFEKSIEELSDKLDEEMKNKNKF